MVTRNSLTQLTVASDQLGAEAENYGRDRMQLESNLQISIDRRTAKHFFAPKTLGFRQLFTTCEPQDRTV